MFRCTLYDESIKLSELGLTPQSHVGSDKLPAGGWLAYDDTHWPREIESVRRVMCTEEYVDTAAALPFGDELSCRRGVGG